MEVDPVASMRCWSIELELDGRAYDVPAIPAVDWWPVLVSANPLDVLDLLVSTDLDERLLSGEVEAADLIPALTDAIEEAAGRSLHAAVVLASVAQAQWPVINGQLAQHGFRWDVQPLGAALDAVYSIVTMSLGEKERKEFLAILENEALSGGKPSPRQQARAADDFESIAGPRPTTGVRSSGGPSGSGRPRTRIRSQPPRQGGRSAGPRPQPGPPAGSAPAASS